ncbi:MAG: hypothetical protein V4772_24915, partial [Pseudomonadota bacterium]
MKAERFYSCFSSSTQRASLFGQKSGICHQFHQPSDFNAAGRESPGSESLSFASPKESNQRKGDP